MVSLTCVAPCLECIAKTGLATDTCWENAMTYGIIGAIILILDIIAIISILGSAKPVGWKVLWTLIVLLLPLIGMILYFVIGNKT